MQGPRTNRSSWNDTFMLQAIMASWRSPDPNSQVGACVVTPDHRMIGTGYNGFPRGVPVDSFFPWDRDRENPLENKYAYVVHAEKNAIVNATQSVEGCTLFATMYPCNECAKDIIQVGIKKVVYLTNPYHDKWFSKAAAQMFHAVRICTQEFEWDDLEGVRSRLMGLCNEQK